MDEFCSRRQQQMDRMAPQAVYQELIREVSQWMEKELSLPRLLRKGLGRCVWQRYRQGLSVSQRVTLLVQAWDRGVDHFRDVCKRMQFPAAVYEDN